MIGTMLLSRDQHADVIFYKFINSKAGKLKVEEFKEDIHNYLGMIGVYNNNPDDLENYQNFMGTHIDTELEVINKCMKKYRTKMAEPVVSLTDERLFNNATIEFEYMIESYIKVYTYYELAHKEQLLLSDMKEMLVEAKGEIL